MTSDHRRLDPYLTGSTVPLPGHQLVSKIKIVFFAGGRRSTQPAQPEGIAFLDARRHLDAQGSTPEPLGDGDVFAGAGQGLKEGEL